MRPGRSRAGGGGVLAALACALALSLLPALIPQARAQAVELKLARVLTYQKKYDEAIGRYRSYLSRHPSDAQAHLELGDVLFWSDRCGEALAEYDAAAKDPKLGAQVERRRGEVLVAMGRFGESGTAIEKALEASPGDVALLLAHARVLSYQKEFDAAVAEYDRALEKEPENLAALTERANVLSWQQRFGEADAGYRRRLEVRYDADTARQRARVLWWAKDYRASLDAYDEAYQRTAIEAIRQEGRAKDANGNKRVLTALDRYGDLIGAEPQNAEALFDRAEIEAYQGMFSAAAADYGRILETDAGHFRAAESLEQLKLRWHQRTLEPYFLWFRARSPDRSTFIDRFTGGAKFRQPLGQHAAALAGYAFDDFYYSDVRSRLRQQGMVGLELNAGPRAWLAAQYLPTDYLREDRLSQLWNANVTVRPFDPVLFTVFTLRDDLYNNPQVFQQQLRTTAVGAKLQADLHRRFTLYADYRYDDINDGNHENDFGVEGLVFVMEEPKRLTIDARFDWQDWKRSSISYFSPQNFWTVSMTVHWRHSLNPHGMYYGARNTFYGIKYRFSADRGKSYCNGGTLELSHDFTPHFSLGAEAFGDYSTVYNDAGAAIRAVGRF